MFRVEDLLAEASRYTLSAPAQARQLLEQALALEPWNAMAYRLLGIIEGDAGNLDIAAQHLETSTDLAPDHPLPLYDLSVVELRRSKINRARDLLEEAILLRGDYVDAILKLGACYLAEGQEIAAFVALKRVIDLGPTGLRSAKAMANVETLAEKDVPPPPRRRGLRGLFRRARPSLPPTARTPLQLFRRCYEERAALLEGAEEAYRDLLTRLDETSRDYFVVAQHFADFLFWRWRFDESYGLSSRSIAGLPCVRSLVVDPKSPLLLEAGKYRDAERIYAVLIEKLFSVKAGLVALESIDETRGIQDIGRAIVTTENEIFEIVRGGNIFLIRATSSGKEIEHQAYDDSHHILGELRWLLNRMPTSRDVGG